MNTQEAGQRIAERFHRDAVIWLVASGDAADHPDHPDAVVPYAARKMAHQAVLRFVYEVDTIRGWELHQAVRDCLRRAGVPVVMDRTCQFCRVEHAMATADERAAAAQAEAERAERERILLGIEPVEPKELYVP